MVRVYFGDALAKYGFGQGHPFGPDRLYAFWEETDKRGLDRRVQVGVPVDAHDEDLLRFHVPEYLERVKRQSRTGEGYLDWGDTPAFSGVYEAAATVVGSSLDALDQAMSGAHRRILIPIAGLHHARRDSAAGFCVFNDAGVMIETLRQRYGVRRVAYVDIDAHHGDGVFYAFEDDPDLILADIHEDGRFLYPGTGFANETGKGAAKGTKLNVPMPPGSTDDHFRQVWPKVEEFVRAGRPEVILLQAGADSLRGDPITDMRFTPAAHAEVAASLCRIADEHSDGRFIVMGGGGYNRQNLALGWNAILEQLLEVGR